MSVNINLENNFNNLVNDGLNNIPMSIYKLIKEKNEDKKFRKQLNDSIVNAVQSKLVNNPEMNINFDKLTEYLTGQGIKNIEDSLVDIRSGDRTKDVLYNAVEKFCSTDAEKKVLRSFVDQIITNIICLCRNHYLSDKDLITINTLQDIFTKSEEDFKNSVQNGLKNIQNTTDKILSIIENESPQSNKNEKSEDKIEIDYFENHYNEMNKIFDIAKLYVSKKLKLKDNFIYPKFEDIDVLSGVNDFINSDEKLMFILGEAGQGKSSLGVKIINDFIDNKNIFNGKIENMAFIKLTDIIKSSNIEVEETPKGIKKMGIKLDDIDIIGTKKLLIYLDGYDEILETLKKILQTNQLETERIFIDYLTETKHVKFIVSSRKNYLSDNIVKGENRKVITKKIKEYDDNEIQSWIDKYNSQPENNYEYSLKDIKNNDNLYELVKIPLLLQLVVVHKIDTKISSRTELYFTIFNKIADRENERADANGRIKSKIDFEKTLMEIAFDYYYNDEKPVAITEKIDMYESAVYHFYTNAGDGKVEFIHRSFYQYFLAKYYLYLLLDEKYEDLLKSIYSRIIDYDVLEFIKELYQIEKRNDKVINFEKIEDFIVETECIPRNMSRKALHEKIAKIFKNLTSIISTVLELEGIDKFNATKFIHILKHHDVYQQNFCFFNLTGANLAGTNLKNSRLEATNFTDASLQESNLSGAMIMASSWDNVDLTGADLSGSTLGVTELKGAKLTKADLSEAEWTCANLTEADLTNSNLSSINLRNVTSKTDFLTLINFTDADLTDANLTKAYLAGANFTGADLTRANLTGANLTNANLSGINLRKAESETSYLTHTDLTSANLASVDLTKACLTGANLTGATLLSANLTSVDLTDADLTRTFLMCANLTGADLRRANLREANLTGVDLQGADLREAYFNKNVLEGVKLNHTNFNGAIYDKGSVIDNYVNSPEYPFRNSN